MSFDRKEFGIKVGDKFINAENQAQADNLQKVHDAIRIQFIKHNHDFEIANNKIERPNEVLHALKNAERAFDAKVAENIGAYKNGLHQELDSILQEGRMEEVEHYIETMSEEFDPKIVQARIREAEQEQEHFIDQEVAYAHEL